MKNYIKLMRPKHYLKNFLILLPLVFSGRLFNWTSLVSSLLGFLSFSLAASIVYIINDICDREKDRLHEKKKGRPIASGKISVKNAVVFAIVLMLVSIALNYLATTKVTQYSYAFIIIYICLNIAYSFGMKNIPLVDITILVSGFLIRVLYGASIIGVSVSNWLYLTIISMSFYLSLGKRRNEIIKSGTDTRKVLKYYSREFLDKNMYMCLAITIVFYSLWCVDPTTIAKIGDIIIWTVPLVILICMKYSMNVESDSHGDPIDVVFEDKVLLILILLYGLITSLSIYIPVIL
ncbi:MAG: decaprenyl-phosphate phosphoribosyltransferase [Bacilli bacterium]|nr:decaprenyl-phosphate phosphoribosyltransferase [Bacilli bacterium]MDD4718567.1 decaprenyl-phosphate phosphoribosyltransferase [Bacilli bacterium]